MFSRRAAPIQLTWIGYPNTTGLDTMTARLTDAEADPVGPPDAWHSEKLIRLPHGFLSYLPPDDAPDIAPTPAQRNGYVTFGSFNNLAKLSPATVAAWAALLTQVPDSRLFLKARPLGDPGTRSRILAQFAAHGVGEDRLILQGYVRRVAHHLEVYNEVDIALDPFPYNGTTTTCEALWMGVPLITLAGRVHAGRVGVSLLTRVGLEELIAPDVTSYVACAVELARDRTRLSVLRAGLRHRMRESMLTNAKAVTASVEAVYRDLWRRLVEAGQ